jgi:hypothetical protein
VLRGLINFVNIYLYSILPVKRQGKRLHSFSTGKTGGFSGSGTGASVGEKEDAGLKGPDAIFEP